MKKETITVYKAFDSTQFDNEISCLEYEFNALIKNEIEKWLDSFYTELEHPIEDDFIKFLDNNKVLLICYLTKNENLLNELIQKLK